MVFPINNPDPVFRAHRTGQVKATLRHRKLAYGCSREPLGGIVIEFEVLAGHRIVRNQRACSTGDCPTLGTGTRLDQTVVFPGLRVVIVRSVLPEPAFATRSAGRPGVREVRHTGKRTPKDAILLRVGRRKVLREIALEQSHLVSFQRHAVSSVAAIDAGHGLRLAIDFDRAQDAEHCRHCTGDPKPVKGKAMPH
jgi:hypothetical protein